jgi:protein involved in polysaccharide export with SLBB domain
LSDRLTAPADTDIKAKWHTITVMGEVREPKDQPVLPNAGLLTYIARSGGPSGAADLTNIKIISRSTDTRIKTNLSTDRMVNQLQAGDVVLVRAIDTRPSVFDKILTYASTISAIVVPMLSLIMP